MAIPRHNAVLLPSSDGPPQRSQAPRQIGWHDGKLADDHALHIIEQVCRLAGSGTLLIDLVGSHGQQRLAQAISRRNTPALYDWLVRILSYQGVSDRVADSYMRAYGSATWAEIEDALSHKPPCPKLQSHWHYAGCRYDKGSRSCAEPDFLDRCPVPAFQLRNGRLNQTAFSLYFFVRDIAGGELVGWIDRQLTRPDLAASLQHESLLAPMRNIYGVSNKLLAMALSSVLLAGPKHWHRAGFAMIAIDTLVHNYLHRTGILNRFGAQHLFGPRCYAANGCASILQSVAEKIDARQFNPAFPKCFPRFVQHAIWRYCAQSGINVCNGNQIDDRRSCQNTHCRLFRDCDRVVLSRQKPRKKADF